MKRVKRSVLIIATVGIVILGMAVTSAGAQTPAQTTAQTPAQTPTFTKDVAPILYNSCVSCHRDGEIAPMALITYQDVRPWAKSIKTQVVSRTMPPWGANPHFGKFRDDRSLSEKQIDTIVKWVDSGAPKGNDADLPALPKFAGGWTNGQPDIVIEMPVDFELPAEGEIPVTDFFVKAPFTEDVYVKAVEVRPGTPGVVHHAGLYVIDKMPEGAKLVNGRILSADGKMMTRNQVARASGGSATQELQKLLSFVPGRGFEKYQGRAGQIIKAGALINFYMHYQATGEPTKDRTKIGLYLAKKGEEVTHQIYHSFNVAGPTTYIVEGEEVLPRGAGAAPGGVVQDEGGVDLPNIPPYVESFKVVSIHSITEPITLYGLTPHLHLRGKSMRYTATLPDGAEEVLLDVPRYDFNWQIYYELEKPRNLPAGSKVTVTTIFDNSPKNKYNPAPEKEVWWSEQSWDEMYAPQARVTVDSRDLRKPASQNQDKKQ